MKEETKPKVICYLKVKQKNAPIFKYVKELEQYCHEKYEIVEWYIDILNDKEVVNPSLIRMMKDITTHHNLCNIIVTLNKWQLAGKEEGMNVCKNLFKNVGIDWIVVDNQFSLFSISIIDVMMDTIGYHKSQTKIDEMETEIDRIKDELYME